MLQFFEQEPETLWLVSDAPHDHCKRLTMRDHANFLLRTPSIFINSAGSSNIESRVQGSNVSSEIERFNSYNDDFLNIASQDCNSYRFESFSSLAALNQIPGQASLTANPMHSRVSELATHRNAIGDTKKQRKNIITGHQIIDKQVNMGRESKRFKLAHHDVTKASAITVKKSQKLGDKITALQQLVSPFGKTDTASVLREASVYIKALHEQIRVLSSPYFTAKTSLGFQGNAGANISLRDRGLSLAPISSTIMNQIDQELHDHRTIHL